MKNKYLIILIFFITLTVSVKAQNTIAKLKFEEAEQAFNDLKLYTTLQKLNEAEKILGSSNPKILYLRIMAEAKIVEAGDSLALYSEIDTARSHCRKYLMLYEKIPGIEEKYREVYLVSEMLNKFPGSESEYYATIRKYRKKWESTAFSPRSKSDIEYKADLTQAETLIKSNGKDPSGYSLKGMALFGLKDTIGAIENLSIAIEKSKKDPANYMHRALYYIYINNFERAIDDYNNALKITKTPQEQILLHQLLASLLGDDKVCRFTEAIKEISETIKLDPDQCNPYVLRASYYAKSGQFDLAFQDLEYALAKAKNNEIFLTAIFFYRGYYKMLKGDFAEAYDEMRRAGIFKAKDFTIQYWKAKINVLLGDRKPESYEILKRVANTSIDSGGIAILSYYLTGNKQLAYQHADAGIRKNQKDPENWINKAKLLAHEKNISGVIASLNMAGFCGYKNWKWIELDPDFKTIMNNAEFQQFITEKQNAQKL